MDWKRLAALLLAGAVALTAAGCMKREIVVNQTGEKVPDFSIKDDIVIDWEQVIGDTEEILNADDYPLGAYLDYAVYENGEDGDEGIEEKYVVLLWPCSNEISEEEACEYAKAYAQAFNDAVRTQDFRYAASGGDYYGGFWDEYTLELKVFREDDILFPQDYLVYQVIRAGSNDKIKPLSVMLENGEAVFE